jgi:hypothetical protein
MLFDTDFSVAKPSIMNNMIKIRTAFSKENVGRIRIDELIEHLTIAYDGTNAGHYYRGDLSCTELVSNRPWYEIQYKNLEPVMCQIYGLSIMDGRLMFRVAAYNHNNYIGMRNVPREAITRVYTESQLDQPYQMITESPDCILPSHAGFTVCANIEVFAQSMLNTLFRSLNHPGFIDALNCGELFLQNSDHVFEIIRYERIISSFFSTQVNDEWVLQVKDVQESGTFAKVEAAMQHAQMYSDSDDEDYDLEDASETFSEADQKTQDDLNEDYLFWMSQSAMRSCVFEDSDDFFTVCGCAECDYIKSHEPTEENPPLGYHSESEENWPQSPISASSDAEVEPLDLNTSVADQAVQSASAESVAQVTPAPATSAPVAPTSSDDWSVDMSPMYDWYWDQFNDSEELFSTDTGN